MALAVGGQLLRLPAAPAGGAAAKQLFDELAARFRMDAKVATWLVDEAGLESLEDFTHFFTSEQEIQSLAINKIADLQNPQIQASRLRQAWAAAKQASSISDSRKRRGVEEDDIDALLPNESLTDIGRKFHARYRVNFGIKMEPSDHLVSRIAKEIIRRMLQAPCARVFNCALSARTCCCTGPCGISRQDNDSPATCFTKAPAYC